MKSSIYYKPYPEYKPSGIDWTGDVPAHWDVVQLGRIGTFSKCSGGTKADEVPEGIPCVRYGDLYTSHRTFIEGTRSFITEEKAQVYTPIKYGDILFAGSGETIDEIGTSAVNLIESQVRGGGDIILFRPQLQMDARFSGYLLDSSQSRLQKSCMGRGITVMHVYASELKYLWLSIPPLDEQRAIVRYLDHAADRIRRAISAKERLIELLTEQRQAVIHRAVTRGLDPDVRLKDSGVEWLGDVPEHWDVRRLRHTGEAIIGLTYSPQDVVDEGAGTLVLRASNIFEGQLNYQDSVFVNCPIPDRLVVKDGDIVLCSRSGSRALIGKNAKIDSEVAGATFGAFMTVFRSESNDYLHHVFNSKLFENQSGAFLTSTINQLTLGILNDFKVPWPPSEERTAVIRYLDKAAAGIDTAIDKAQRQIGLLREYRTRLIADVVTGQMDVRGVVQDEVELPVS